MVLPSRNDTQYKQRRRSSPVRSLAIVGSLLLFVWAFTTGRLIWSAAPQQGPLWRRGAATAATSVAVDKRRMPDGSWAPTLLVYVFSNTDPEYINNLRFFVQFGMAPDDGVTYIIVVQEAEGQPTPELPMLPPNGRYVHHNNECYDWGTIGWVFSSGKANPEDYKFFIFMNSSVRGPFVPPYARGGTRWHDLFFNRLSDHVKLVGPTISCEGSPFEGNAKGEWRTNPHVQSYVLATDKVGLDVWLRDGNVFHCWSSMWDVIWHGELGSSLALLKAGFGLDSFMMRYQDVDWLDQANWKCNKQANPYGEFYLDGVSLNPFEVLFVKVKERVVQSDWSFALQAVKYTEWMEAQASGKPDVVSNVYRDDPKPFRYPRLAWMQARGPDCWDETYYLQQNPDLGHYTTKEELWGHFLRGGAYEGRGFRFTCPYDPMATGGVDTSGTGLAAVEGGTDAAAAAAQR